MTEYVPFVSRKTARAGPAIVATVAKVGAPPRQRIAEIATLAAQAEPHIEWMAGLGQLRRCQPPVGVFERDWRARILHAARFCRAWGQRAASQGWTAETLFGLHPAAPLLRFDVMGVAFLGADAVVVSVEPEVIVFRAANGTTTRANPPTNPQAAAWLGPWMQHAEVAMAVEWPLQNKF